MGQQLRMAAEAFSCVCKIFSWLSPFASRGMSARLPCRADMAAVVEGCESRICHLRRILSAVL